MLRVPEHRIEMKNLIIIIGTIILGVYIFNMMVGDGEDSLKSVSKDIMMKTIESYSTDET